MNNTALRHAVAREMLDAEMEHDPIAELTELSVHIQKQLAIVIKRLVELEFVRDNDSPDKTTCCTECGHIMDTPARGVESICAHCVEADADYRAAWGFDLDNNA